MRDFSMVRSTFWTGATGRGLRAIGRDAQLLAIYLITCHSSNMLGLYYLPLTTIAHELGMTLEGASEALRRVIEVGFCQYDFDAEEVWVPKMARHQIGERLSPEDNRVKSIRKMAESLAKSRFFCAFLEWYGAAFHLSELKPLARPSEAPPKPLRSQEQEQEQEQEQDSSSPEPEEPAAGQQPADITPFPCVGQTKHWRPSQAKFNEWVECFPALNVPNELRKARQWLLDNPGRMKTAKGMTRFIFGWLERAQNDGRGKLNGNGQKTRVGPGQSFDPNASQRDPNHGRM